MIRGNPEVIMINRKKRSLRMYIDPLQARPDDFAQSSVNTSTIPVGNPSSLKEPKNFAYDTQIGHLQFIRGSIYAVGR